MQAINPKVEPTRRETMTQVINATFENGVFKPEQPLDLPRGTRAQVIIEQVRSPEEREKAWAELERLWKEHPINSGGERLTRDQLHERR
jgi:predicted DNA-binding antitoxin AbrB/MazE fold protein